LVPEEALLEFAAGEHDLFVYVLSGGSLRVLDLGDRSTLEKEVWDYIGVVFEHPRVDAPASVSRAGNSLFERLLGSALELLRPEVSRLIIVPNEWLAALPFEALVTERRETPPRSFAEVRYLLDRFDVSYAPSSAVLGDLLSRPPRSRPGRALLLGDPVFPSEEGGAADPRDKASGLLRLSKSRAEVLAIADLLLPDEPNGATRSLGELWSLGSERRRNGAMHAPTFDLYVGHDANADLFLGRDLTDYSILHFATHAKSDGNDPAQSALWLSAGISGSRELDLAGIRALRLDSDLVTLSACETARGRILKGEGVQSIALAFLEAGARGVVASLWDVGDDNAADLMSRFYANALVSTDRPFSTSLTLAKRAIRMDPASRGAAAIDGSPLVLPSGHPDAWAKFVYIGATKSNR
jgi:CHAT domain-containing protein